MVEVTVSCSIKIVVSIVWKEKIANGKRLDEKNTLKYISRKVTTKLQLRRRPKNGDLHLEPTSHKYQKLQLCWFRCASSNNRI